MLDQPRIVQTRAQPAAVIRLTIPREEIRNVMGPAIHRGCARGPSPRRPLLETRTGGTPA